MEAYRLCCPFECPWFYFILFLSLRATCFFYEDRGYRGELFSCSDMNQIILSKVTFGKPLVSHTHILCSHQERHWFMSVHIRSVNATLIISVTQFLLCCLLRMVSLFWNGNKKYKLKLKPSYRRVLFLPPNVYNCKTPFIDLTHQFNKSWILQPQMHRCSCPQGNLVNSPFLSHLLWCGRYLWIKS